MTDMSKKRLITWCHPHNSTCYKQGKKVYKYCVTFEGDIVREFDVWCIDECTFHRLIVFWNHQDALNKFWIS